MSDDATTLPAEGFVRLPTVCAVCGMSDTTVWRRSAKGRFPQSIRLSTRLTVWRVEDIREFLRDPLNYRADTSERAA